MRGQSKAGHGRVNRPGGEAGGGRCALRGQPQTEAKTPSPEKARQQERQRRHQPHVEAGDGHEMSRAGVSEHPPVVFFNSTAYADGERRNDTGELASGKARHYFVGGPLAPAMQLKAAAAGQPQGLPAGAHVAGGADALDEQPALVVESAGIEVPPRGAQPQAQAPALARLKWRRLVPAKTRLAGELRRRGRAPGSMEGLHAEFEAGPPGQRLRHPHYPAHGNHFSPVQRWWKHLAHGQVAAEHGPKEADDE